MSPHKRTLICPKNNTTNYSNSDKKTTWKTDKGVVNLKLWICIFKENTNMSKKYVYIIYNDNNKTI
jgi:hypothetical protein